MAKTSIAVNEWASAGFKDFVTEEFISAPNTQIQSRALVSNSLKTVMGNERVHVRNPALLPKEAGPNGESVFEAESKDARIRFVGAWFGGLDQGAWIGHTSVGDFIEVTFYGTGLNLLSQLNASARDVRVTVDGGSEGGNVFPNSGVGSGTLDSRNYAVNGQFTMVAGLAVGWHTVKLRVNAVSTLRCYGFEILNERSNVLIPTGSAFSGMKKSSLLSAVTSAHNSSISGARGGRVIKYLLDGAIAEAVTNVDATSRFLANTDHTNEEAVRTIVFSEFGAGRSDDWSAALSSSTRAFTLDDGVTSLLGVIAGGTTSGEGIIVPNMSVGNFYTITFVGTGLDVVGSSTSGGATASAGGVVVDGVSQGEISVTAASGTSFLTRQKICSGLPYGTHTVKITRNAEVIKPYSFIVYQPKKPTLPVGAIELCDYNVMATYVANSTASNEAIATGVLRKHVARESVFINGSGGASDWTISGVDSTKIGGFEVTGQRNTQYVEYIFFGTGFDFRSLASTGFNNTVAVLLQNLSAGGSLLAATTANFPGIASTGYGANGPISIAGGGSFNQNNAASTAGSGVTLTGLTLGLWKVRFNDVGSGGGGNGGVTHISALDIITPIHSHDKGFFKIGSLAMQDSRITKPLPIPEKGIDLSKAKAWVVIDQVNGQIKSSFNVSSVVSAATGQSWIFFTRPFKTDKYAIATSTDSNGAVLVDTSSGRTSAARCYIIVVGSSHTVVNATYLAVVFYGELENEDTQ